MDKHGLIVMLISVTSVFSLVSYCMYRVLTLPSADVSEIRGELDIDTGDTSDAD